MPFVAFSLGFLWLISGDSIASLFIFIRIGFEPCNNYTLSCSLKYVRLPVPAISVLQDVITVICLLILSLAL